jgi:hypothetical protein
MVLFLNRQQGLMLLRGQSHGSSRHFTKAQTLAQIKAKRILSLLTEGRCMHNSPFDT